MLKENLDKLLLRAEQLYNYDKEIKHYHNWNHALRVIETTSLIMSAEYPDEYHYSIHLAAMYHDAIYIPKAPNGINELASSASLSHAWNYLNINDNIPTLHRANKLIEATTVNHHLMQNNLLDNKPLQILLDADLNSLADPYDDFCETQSRIILENHGDPTKKESRILCSNFLSTFLTCRPNIYHTKTARSWYEAAAKKNIKQYINDNKVTSYLATSDVLTTP